MGTPGEISQVGDLIEWRSSGDLGQRAITLSSDQGHTDISASANLASAAAVTFVPAGILGAFVAILGFIQAADSGSAAGMLLSVVAIPALFLVMRVIFARISRAESARLEQVMGGTRQAHRRNGHPRSSFARLVCLGGFVAPGSRSGVTSERWFSGAITSRTVPAVGAARGEGVQAFYDSAFSECLAGRPRSAFLAEGSPLMGYRGRILGADVP